MPVAWEIEVPLLELELLGFVEDLVLQRAQTAGDPVDRRTGPQPFDELGVRCGHALHRIGGDLNVGLVGAEVMIEDVDR